MQENTTILVVENERIVAEDIRDSLTKLGYQVQAVVASGNEAIELVEAHAPDLLLMDIVLKGEMNGIETVETIRNRYDIPVVYLTAYADQTTLDKAKITEPFGYIIKPFDERELHSTLEMALYKHRMEIKLKKSEVWFSTILKSIGDGVIVTDREQNITFMNSVALELTGRIGEAAGGKLSDAFRAVDEKGGKEWMHVLDEVLKEGMVKTEPGRTLLLLQDHDTIPIDYSVAPVRDENGAVAGAVLVFHDIVERRLVEEALRESEERYRALFEDTRDAIYMTTRTGDFIMANHAALELFGIPGKKMAYENIQTLFKDPGVWDSLRQELGKREYIRDYEFELTNKKGFELNCLLTTSVRKDSMGETVGYQGMIRDITESKRDALEKEKMQAQLQQASKMEAVGILAGGVAHDFNNLLTVIQGNIDLLSMKFDKNSQEFQDLSEIHTAVMRASDLTRQLLMFSRKHSIELKPVLLNDMLHSLIKMLQRLIGEDVSISTAFQEKLWQIRADTGTLEQVIMNMAVNSRDAMPSGGTLSLETCNVVVTEKDCRGIPGARPGKFVRLSIQDTGTGMDEETVRRIFEPFFSTKGPGKGTGLGLSVAYGIVHQHEGWIQVQSALGKGSTFHLYLPVYEGKKKSDGSPAVSSGKCTGHGERILIVEDDENVVEFAKRALTGNGYDVVSTTCHDQALEVFRHEEGAFDMVMSDVVLPGKNGIELVSTLLGLKPELRILLSSGYTDQKSQCGVIQEKGYRFLPKPFTLAALLQSVRETLGTA